MNVGEAIGLGAAALLQAGIRDRDEAAREAAILLSYCLGVDTARLYTLAADPGEEVIRRFNAALDRRRAREPLQYITGVQEFMSLEFRVDRRVLIPRPETEILVETVLDFSRRGGTAGAARAGDANGSGEDPGDPDVPRVFRFADVGTGSGGIAVSVAKYASEWARVEGYATDVSAGALEVARENAGKHGVDGLITFLEGYLLEPVARMGVSKVLDCVASNPPYIEPADFDSLQPEVRLFEPAVALRCGDPVALYRRIAIQAAQLLRDGGMLAVEVGAGQAGDVAVAFAGTGLYGATRIARDLAGIERVVYCHRTS